MSLYSTIGWVDEYVRNVAPFIRVREADSLLIKIPNQAFRLNGQGLKVLKFLLSGGSVYGIVDRYQEREAVASDIHSFFCDLRSLLKGCYREYEARRAVEKVPFSLPFNTLPVLSEVAVTYRCNLSGRFCYASCGCRKESAHKELGTDSMKEIIRIIKEEAEVPSVSFTGGEPTLRDDIVELVVHAKSLDMWTNLITNGSLITERMAHEFRESGLDSAQVSLEAGSASLHDFIVRRQGAFERVVQGLLCLKEAGIRVHTNTTISGLNRERLTGILDLVKKIGLDKFSMNMLMPQGSALESLDDVLVTYSEIGEIILEVAGRAEEMGLEFMWYSPTPMCIFNPIAHGLGNKGCAACDGLLSVAPNGDILPCSSFPEPVGNILEIGGRFKEAWRSEEFEYFQKKLFAHDRCRSCPDLEACNGGCPLYWEKVGYGELLEKRGEVNR